VNKIIGDKLIVKGLEEGERIVAIGTENVEEGILVEIRKEIEE